MLNEQEIGNICKSVSDSLAGSLYNALTEKITAIVSNAQRAQGEAETARNAALAQTARLEADIAAQTKKRDGLDLQRRASQESLDALQREHDHLLPILQRLRDEHRKFQEQVGKIIEGGANG